MAFSKRFTEFSKTLKKPDVIDKLITSIDNSGRAFKDVPQSSIYNFLEKEGVSRGDFSKIYESVYSYYSNRPRSSTTTNGGIPVKSSQLKPAVVDIPTNFDPSKISEHRNGSIITTDQNLKQRIPRKNVFSEIKKITK